MSEFSVERGGMRAAIDEMQRTTKKIDDDLNKLEADAEANLSRWLGEARQAYLTEKKNWDAAIVAMNAVLANAGTTLGSMLSEYDQTEFKAAAAWTP